MRKTEIGQNQDGATRIKGALLVRVAVAAGTVTVVFDAVAASAAPSTPPPLPEPAFAMT